MDIRTSHISHRTSDVMGSLRRSFITTNFSSEVNGFEDLTKYAKSDVGHIFKKVLRDTPKLTSLITYHSWSYFRPSKLKDCRDNWISKEHSLESRRNIFLWAVEALLTIGKSQIDLLLLNVKRSAIANKTKSSILSAINCTVNWKK
jgi:hypothetical protein